MDFNTTSPINAPKCEMCNVKDAKGIMRIDKNLGFIESLSKKIDSSIFICLDCLKEIERKVKNHKK